MYALSKAQAGDICTIKWMFGLPEAVDFLRQHHVEEGETIQVIRKLLSFLCNRNEVSYYIKKSVFWQENWSYQIPDGRLHKNRTVNIVQNSVDFTEKVC